MSKIRLHGSSSGYMEIAPPAAASSATITLPNSAGEVLLSDGSAASLTQIPAANIVGVCTSGLTKGGGGFGKIIQVEQTVKTDTFSAQLNVGTVSGDAISLDFTATSSSNKLYITYDLVMGVEGGNQRLGATLYVGGSVSSFRGDASSSSQRVSTNGSSYEEWQSQNLAGHALLSNPSTSSTTYSLRISHGNHLQKYVYMNRAAVDDGAAYTMRPCSTLTIMEVAS